MHLGLFIACAAGVLTTHSAMAIMYTGASLTNPVHWAYMGAVVGALEAPFAAPILAAQTIYRR